VGVERSRGTALNNAELWAGLFWLALGAFVVFAGISASARGERRGAASSSSGQGS
jgi:hypothetical protein